MRPEELPFHVKELITSNNIKVTASQFKEDVQTTTALLTYDCSNSNSNRFAQTSEFY